MVEFIGYAAQTIFWFMSFVFLSSIFLRRHDIVDIAWGLGFIMVVISIYLNLGIALPKTLLVLTFVVIWGARLAFRIFIRKINQPEDPRYKEVRQNWKKLRWLQTYLKVYLLQGFFMLLICLSPIIIMVSDNGNFGLLDGIAALIWALGFLIESLADLQLDQFMADGQNKGKIMSKGLWAWSRHPNYFGEILMWWAIWFIALPLDGGLIAIISPLTITFLLIFVSGIPTAEKMITNLDGATDYKAKTSILIPRPPR